MTPLKSTLNFSGPPKHRIIVIYQVWQVLFWLQESWLVSFNHFSPNSRVHTYTSQLLFKWLPRNNPLLKLCSVSSYLVVLQIPTFHLLVLSAGKQVRTAIADGHTPHRADVTGEGQLQFPTRQVPNLTKQFRYIQSYCTNWPFHHSFVPFRLYKHYLYGPISWACDKPLISRLHCDGSHPAQMTTDDLLHTKQRTQAVVKFQQKKNIHWRTKTPRIYPKQFPRRMPLGFGHCWSSSDQRRISGSSSLQMWLQKTNKNLICCKLLLTQKKILEEMLRKTPALTRVPPMCRWISATLAAVRLASCL